MSSPRLPTASWCACVARQRRGLFRWLRRVGDTTLRIIPNQFVSDPEVLEGRDDMGAVWPFGKEIFALPAAGTSVPATAFRVMTQGRSRMRQFRTYGSVRGVFGQLASLPRPPKCCATIGANSRGSLSIFLIPPQLFFKPRHCTPLDVSHRFVHSDFNPLPRFCVADNP